MNIIIDCDVFWASKSNQSSSEALQSIKDKAADRADEFNLIVNNNLIEAYTDFLETFVGPTKTEKIGKNKSLRLAVSFMGDILGTSKRRVDVNKRKVNTSAELQKIFSDYDILSDEQTLLIIADSMQQIQSKNITLLITEPPTETLPLSSPEVVPRQLYQGKTPFLIDNLRSVIPDLVIAYTSDEDIFSSKSKQKPLPNVKQADYIFELFSAIWMARNYGCIPGPQRRKIRGEEIDGWCYKIRDNQVTEVYVGEAKHRTNIEKGIDGEVVDQLEKKIEAVKNFDWAELELKATPDTQYFGLIISNSVCMENSGVAASIQKLSNKPETEIIIVEANVPNDWMKNDQARLSDTNFKAKEQTYEYELCS